MDPSGDVTPSIEDITVTTRLVELGIEGLDHVIVNAKADYNSMKEH
ncbi:JAB domain-containing protein [Niallia sp. 01092]